MKKVLDAIKKFFLAIINWVKATAWVQPLLIVGAIFGLIMSIKPISNWIGEVTNVEGTSKFYDNRFVNLEELELKIDETGDNTKKTLIVIYIQEDNKECANCKAAEKPLENFFNSDHSKYENARDYEIVVLDIASDEFIDEDTGDELLDIRDHIEKYGLEYVYADIAESNSSWVNAAGKEIDSSDEDSPLATPCIARYEDGACVAVKMGYDSNDKKEFEKFCYYDPETDFKEEF